MPAESPRQQLKSAIQQLLPEDGTPVLNRVMRVMLAQRLRRSISEAEFFAVRDELAAEGAVGRLRGQGGQVFLARPEPPPEPSPSVSQKVDVWSEADLMPPLQAYLDGPFKKGLDLPEASACIVQNTSAIGPYRGKWARPDFILVSVMRFKLLPGSQVDLHSFELKTETGGSVLAIHEALAQTRFTHFGHFVWHLPPGSKYETMLDDVVTHCEEHGIGLIRMKDPLRTADVEGCEILADPKRKPTLPLTIDGFLESRLTGDQKKVLTSALSLTS